MWNSADSAAQSTGLIRALILVCFSVCCFGCSQPDQQSSESRALNPGDPQTATHNPNIAIVYVFNANPGSSYLIRAGQENANLVLRIVDPDTKVTTVDSLSAGDGPEFALVENASEGEYRITVSASQSAQPEVTHNIHLTDLGTDFVATAPLLEASRLMSSATVNYWIIWNWDKAIRYAGQAAQRYADAGRLDLQADAIMFQAAAMIETLFSANDKPTVLQQIIAYLRESATIFERLGDTSKLAKTLYYEGLAHQNVGQDERARVAYDAALRLHNQFDEWREKRLILLNLAVMENSAGNYHQGIVNLQELLQLESNNVPTPLAADRNFVATVQDQLGFAQAQVENYDDALWAFFNAAQIHTEVGDQHGAAESLRGIARIYLDSGDLQAAKNFVSRADAAAQISSNGRVIGVLISTLGNMMYGEGDYLSAREFQSRALELAPLGGPVLAERQVQLARTLLALEEFENAFEYADAGLREARRINSELFEAEALHQVGLAHLRLGDPGRAVVGFEGALNLYASLGMTAKQADTAYSLSEALFALAQASNTKESRSNMLDQAQERSEQALEQVEWLLSKVTDPELRARLAATRRSYYQSHIGLLMARFEETGPTATEYVSTALETNERARARMTLDLLNEASVGLQERVDPDIASQMTNLLNELAVLEEQRDALLRASEFDDLNRDKLATVSAAIADIKVRFDINQVSLRQRDNRYRALTAPETIGIKEIQNLIDDESVLIQYSLGEPNSHAWVVSQDSISAVKLADRQTIESAAEQAFASLRTHEYTKESRQQQHKALNEVSELVLQPLAELVGHKRLIVVADGSLHYLPFQTLTLQPGRVGQMLMHSREVIALPSMSVLAALRQRAGDLRPQRSVAVFADPVFDTTDSRFRSAAESACANTGTVADNTSRGSSNPFERLRGTLLEACAIAELVPEDHLLLQTGFDVKRSTLVNRDLSSYRIVHFATHGSVNRKTPALSSLALSMVDESGSALDGNLRLHDIYRLNIDADVVVLSACETGAGTDIDGEGLIGLTQGFFYAGARSLVVSLWDVPDGATAALMTQFYRHVLDDGKTPAAALRAAQISMAGDPRWKDPFYWGAFILLGDWQ